MTTLHDFRALGLAVGISAALFASGCGSGPLSNETSARSLTDKNSKNCEKYAICDLGPIAPAMGHQVINASGQVVGTSGVAFSLTAGHAFRTQPHQAINPTSDLGTLGNLNAGSTSDGFSINDAGQVVGTSSILPASPVVEQAFRTKPNGVLQQGPGLGVLNTTTLGNCVDSNGMGINASGQVVGTADFLNPATPTVTVPGITRAFCTTANGDLTTATDLGSLGGPNSYALCINASGKIAGYSATAPGLGGNGNRHAFRTGANSANPADPHPAISLADDLGLFPNGGSESFALAINGAGQVAGSASTSTTGSSTTLQHAFRTTAHGKVSDPNTNLGTLTGDTFSEADAINSAGQVVGTSGIIDTTSGNLNGNQRAIFVDVGTNPQMIDLNTRIPANSGWVLREAHGINNAGQIAGWGLIGGQPHGFLLTPQ